MRLPTLQKLLYAADILAILGLAAYVGTTSTNAFEDVYKPVLAKTVLSSQLRAGRSASANHYSSCWKAGAPDDSSVGTVEQNSDTTQMINKRFTLYSTFFIRSNDKREGFAAIAYDRQERVYAENEKVEDYVLAQVFPNKVILKKGGLSFTLERDTNAGPASRMARQPKRPSRGDSRSRPVRKIPPNAGLTESAGANRKNVQKFTVSEKDKNYIAENFAKILHDVNLQTELGGKNKSMTGVKINTIKPGSILYRVGNLRPGDIIRKVNGKPINSMSQAFALHGELTKQNVKRVTVEIERNGKLLNRTYSITDQNTK